MHETVVDNKSFVLHVYCGPVRMHAGAGRIIPPGHSELVTCIRRQLAIFYILKRTWVVSGNFDLPFTKFADVDN